ncbi:MAG: hypothetical protein ACYDHW_02230 [Syntrophorhabdaceae bacterium]
MNKFAQSLAAFLVVFIFLSGTASSQWVYVGRKALGKVKQLTSEADDSDKKTQAAAGTQNTAQSGYDAATVLLGAPAEKVYATAVNVLQSNKDFSVKKKDDKALSIEFIRGDFAAGMQITPLSEKLSQLLIVSSHPGKTGSSIVLNGILRICKEMGIHCEYAE